MNLETKNKLSICIKIIINLFKKGMQYFLLLLKDKMNTETAKQMAENRHQFLITFLKELEKELDWVKYWN